MEHLARKMAASIGRSLGRSDEEIAVMAYGFIGILQFFAIFLCSLVIGILFGFWIETVVVFLSVGFLRRFTGGAHSSGIYHCLVYSVFFVSIISAAAHYWLPLLPMPVNGVICGAIFAFGYVMIALKAPVTPPNKPCRTEKKRKRLRRGAFLSLSLFAIFVLLTFIAQNYISRLFTIGLSLAVSTLWQVTMMTKAGAAFVTCFDSLFMKKR